MKRNKPKKKNDFLTRREMLAMKRRYEIQKEERMPIDKKYHVSVCVDSCKQEDRFVLTDPKPLSPEQLTVQKSAVCPYGVVPKKVLEKQRKNSRKQKIKSRRYSTPKNTEGRHQWIHIIYTPMK